MTPQFYLYIDNVKKFIGRHHPVIFITGVSLALAACVGLLYWVLVLTSVDESTTTSTITSFDKETIERIKNLNISSNSADATLTLPPSRPNPFVE